MRCIVLATICLFAHAASADDDWGANATRSTRVSVLAVQQALARDPYDDRALPALVSLYTRYRTVAKLETWWPESGRGYFEWSTLALVYLDATEDERRSSPIDVRIAIAPTEVTTQRALIALLDKLRPDEALAQHQRAARLAPSDVNLQLESRAALSPAPAGQGARDARDAREPDAR